MMAHRVARVVQYAKKNGLDASDLANEVMDWKRMEAASINRGGLRSQIEYLMEAVGEEGTENILNELVARNKEETT